MEKKKVNDILSLLVPKFIKDLMYQGKNKKNIRIEQIVAVKQIPN